MDCVCHQACEEELATIFGYSEAIDRVKEVQGGAVNKGKNGEKPNYWLEQGRGVGMVFLKCRDRALPETRDACGGECHVYRTLKNSMGC